MCWMSQVWEKTCACWQRALPWVDDTACPFQMHHFLPIIPWFFWDSLCPSTRPARDLRWVHSHSQTICLCELFRPWYAHLALRIFYLSFTWSFSCAERTLKGFCLKRNKLIILVSAQCYQFYPFPSAKLITATALLTWEEKEPAGCQEQ